ncbi:MAG: radical SAM protein [Chitinivibrionia bacterium]|nr:radical SAM protein [Chitinivibrionia bacterium]
MRVIRVIKEAIKIFFHRRLFLSFRNIFFNAKGNRRLKYIEIHLAEHCNLNCAYCLHNCPVADKSFPDIAQFEKDFIKLQKLTDGHIDTVKLLGGEPLLNPDITRFMEISRKYIPHGKIMVVTNGILLTQMNEEFWTTAKNNNISVFISKYPIKLDMKKILKTAKKYKVNLEIRKSSGFFVVQKYDTTGKRNNLTAYKNCGAKDCTFLKDGKIYLCAEIFCSKYLQTAFNVNFSISQNDFLVLDEINNLREISDFISRPAPFCRYCASEESKWQRWKISEKKKEDWIL